VKVLGDEALDLKGLAGRRRRALGEELPPINFGDLFFEGDSPIRPDRDDG
jgi:hypothetical protein